MSGLELIFQYGNSLREGYVGVFEIGDAERETVEDHDENARSEKDQGQWRIRDAQEIGQPVQSRLRPRQREENYSRGKPAHRVFDANVGAANRHEDHDSECDAENRNNVKETIHVLCSTP